MRRTITTSLSLLLSQVFLAASLPAAIIDLQNTALNITTLGKDVKPKALNASGVVVGQNSSGVAFKWDSGTFTALGTLGGTTSYANDINNDGVIVGWSQTTEGVQKAFKYDGSSLANIDSVSSLSSSAVSISNQGAIVGWKYNGSAFRSSLWTDTFTNGQLIFGTGSHQATGINDSGKIVGINLDSSNAPQQGYYWNGTDPLTNFSSLIGSQYFPTSGINSNDLTAGRSSGTAHVLQIGEATSANLGKISFADPFSEALSLNNIGLVVGDSGMKGFAYDLSTSTMYNMNDFQKLNPAEYSSITILNITDINDNNQFVGTYLLNGEEYGFRGAFVAIPEPQSLVISMVIILFAALAFRSNIHSKKFQIVQ